MTQLNIFGKGLKQSSFFTKEEIENLIEEHKKNKEWKKACTLLGELRHAERNYRGFPINIKDDLK